MKGRALLLLIAMSSAVLLLASGVALAAYFTCSTNPCTGTDQNDSILGTNNPDEIHALAGDDFAAGYGANDQIYGGEGDDRVYGDANRQPSLDGNDKVYGGLGADTVTGDGYSDLLSGGGGKDTIGAEENGLNEFPVAGTDTVKGGRGNDVIGALDHAVDHINCGKGKNDIVVSHDKGMDTIKNCEVVR